MPRKQSTKSTKVSKSTKSTKPAKVVEPVAALNEELEKKRHEFQDEVAHRKPQVKLVPKNNLMVGLALIVALLVGLGAVAVYIFWYQNPDRVVADALVRALGSNTASFNASYKLGASISVDASGGLAGAKGAKLSFAAKTNVNNKQGNFSSDAVMDQDGNIYLSGEGIKSFLGSDLVKDASTQGSYANILQQKIEGKWLEINSDQLQPYSKKYSSVLSCVETVIKKVQTDQPLFKDSADLYANNRFFVVDKTLGNKNGSIGYSIHVDQTKMKAFLTAFKNTSLYGQFHDCDSATFDLNVDTFAKHFDSSSQISSFQLWINAHHDITSIVTEMNVGDSTGTLTFNPQFNQEVKVIVPTATVSLTQVHDYLTDGTTAMALKSATDESSKAQYQALIDKLKATP